MDLSVQEFWIFWSLLILYLKLWHDLFLGKKNLFNTFLMYRLAFSSKINGFPEIFVWCFNKITHESCNFCKINNILYWIWWRDRHGLLFGLRPHIKAHVNFIPALAQASTLAPRLIPSYTSHLGLQEKIVRPVLIVSSDLGQRLAFFGLWS